jgi:hypothetical protein
MSNNPFVAGLLVAAMMGGAHHASAQNIETDATKIKRLEATVEELTLQLADTIQERNRLRSALAQALEAKSQGRQVVSGCDLAAGHNFIAYHSDREGIAAGHWLSRDGNAKKCTKAQLQEISRTYEIRSYDKAYKILRFEISTR